VVENRDMKREIDEGPPGGIGASCEETGQEMRTMSFYVFRWPRKLGVSLATVERTGPSLKKEASLAFKKGDVKCRPFCGWERGLQ